MLLWSIIAKGQTDLESLIVGHTIMLSWEMPSKNIFAYSGLIMGTVKGSIGRFFNFSAQSQSSTGGSNGPHLP